MDRCYFLQSKIYDSTQTKNMSKTLIYFKRKNNACYTINIKPELPFASIVNILARKQSISVDNLLLIHKGKTVQSTEQLTKMANNSIVHVVDRQQVKSQRICINLRDIHNNQSTKIIDSNAKIGNFVRQHLTKIDETPYFQIGLFYLGKILNSQKTFAQELVENNSEIFVINLQDYVKSVKTVSQPQKNQSQVANQDQEIIPKVKINHKIQRKESEKVIELNAAPIRIEQSKCQEVKQQEKKMDQEQKSQELSDILPSDFKQTPSEQLHKNEGENVKAVQRQAQEKEEILQIKDENIKPLQAGSNQVKQKQPNPQQNVLKQEKYIKKQTLQSKEAQQILQQIMQVSQLPEMTYYNFQIKISQVESQDSDDERQNHVEFNQQDHHSIQSSECHKLQPQQEPIKEETKPKQQAQPLQILGQRDILPGDLIFTGADYHNQTVSFIDNLLKQYQGMFE